LTSKDIATPLALSLTFQALLAVFVVQDVLTSAGEFAYSFYLFLELFLSSFFLLPISELSNILLLRVFTPKIDFGQHRIFLHLSVPLHHNIATHSQLSPRHLSYFFGY
jgi:hypothetical protein